MTLAHLQLLALGAATAAKLDVSGVGVLAVGRVLWWIRTLHIQIRTSRDNFLHAGFLSPPVSDRATPGPADSTHLWTSTPVDLNPPPRPRGTGDRAKCDV